MASANSKDFPPGIPPDLANAIVEASNKYNLPPDLLLGIWHVESNSKYPNPYANGLGYGGEFGTAITAPFGPASEVERVSEPPVNDQADAAAQVLTNALAKHNGNIADALSAYSGGGYSSVPGQTTFGTWVPHTSQYLKDVGGGSFTSNIIGTPITDAATSAKKAITAPLSGLGKDIIYGIVLLGGGILILGGIVLIAADIGLGVFAKTRLAQNTSNTLGTVNGYRTRKTETTAKRQRTAARADEIAQARANREARAQSLHDARLKTQAARTTEINSKRRARNKQIRITKTTLQKEREAGYKQGASDVLLTQASRKGARRA